MWNITLPYSPLQLLIQLILKQYFRTTYCLVFVSEGQLNLQNYQSLQVSNIVLTPDIVLEDKMLFLSEMGCSDYVVKINDPIHFIKAFENVTKKGNTRRGDKKIVFLPHKKNIDKLLNIFTIKEISYITNILMILPNNTRGCKVYDLITHKYVGSSDEASYPEYLDQWNSCSGNFSKNADLFPHNMKDLQGKILKVAAFSYEPYVILNIDPALSTKGYDGVDVRVVEEYCRLRNCSIEIYEESIYEWGVIYENNSTGVGVIGSVYEDRTDIGIAGLCAWYEIYHFLDFSMFVLKSSVSVLVPSPRLLPSWMLPFLPFTPTLWLIIFCTFVYSSIALLIANRFSFNNIFLTAFSMMITQSVDEHKIDWRIRSITIWLLITGLILDNAYGGGLSAVFTISNYEKSIDTIQDLLDIKITWAATQDVWIYSIMLSDDPKIKQLVQNFHSYDAEELKRRSFTRTTAFAIEKLEAGNFGIGKYVTREALLNLQQLLEDIYFEQTSISARKGSPYTAGITDLIGVLHQSGLLLAWESQVALNFMDFKIQLLTKLSRLRAENEVRPLNLNNVEGVYFIYLIGVILSFLLFLIEFGMGLIKNM